MTQRARKFELCPLGLNEPQPQGFQYAHVSKLFTALRAKYRQIASVTGADLTQVIPTVKGWRIFVGLSRYLTVVLQIDEAGTQEMQCFGVWTGEFPKVDGARLQELLDYLTSKELGLAIL